jgi:hypothetical protein
MELLNKEKNVERGIIVFCNWAVFGLVGLGFLLEGGARDVYLIGLVGVVGIISGLAGHIIINRVYGQGFSFNETALGLGMFATLLIIFIVSWAFAALSRTVIELGLTLLATLVMGFVVYVSTRYGLRGAFNRFDATSGSRLERKE